VDRAGITPLSVSHLGRRGRFYQLVQVRNLTARRVGKAEFSGGAGTTVVVPRGSYHTFVTATGGRLNRTARQSFITRG
jgi:hypothetical protein